MRQKKIKNGFMPILMIIIVVLLLLVVCGFLYWRMFFSWTSDEMNPVVEKKITEAQNKNDSSQPISSSQPSPKDPALIGTWESGCLVPDPNSPWSEKHQFVIKADGTAAHTRWSSSGHDCSPETTMVDNYQYEIPAVGQINLADSEKGATIYDIYEVSAITLYFGHGFRGDHLAYPSKFGESASNRIDTLNKFIAYQKK